MAFATSRSLTIDHTKVSGSDQSNFPVLVKIVNGSFATVANSGLIQHTVTQSGGNPITMPADLIFTSDSGGATKIPWEFESYDGTTGTLYAWVLIATVSHTVDTVFYVFYGDATVSTQQNTGSFSVANVWDANFKGVYHFPDGTTLNAKDSTGNANNGTLTGSSLATAGKVDGCFDVHPNPDYASVGTLGLTTTFTFSLWIKPADLRFGGLIAQQAHGGVEFRTNNDNTLSLLSAQVSNLATSSGTVTTGAFHYVVLTYDGSTAKFYIDGAASGSTSVSFTFGSGIYDIGRSGGAGDFFSGPLDEARISSTIRSADWITTEFNNQNSPNTFITLGGALTTLAPSAASFTFTDLTPALTRKLQPASASLTFTGATPSERQTLHPAAGSLTFTGETPVTGGVLRPSAATLAFAGRTPTLKTGLRPNAASFVLTGDGPHLRLTLHPTPAVIMFHGLMPSLTGASFANARRFTPIDADPRALAAVDAVNRKLKPLNSSPRSMEKV